MQLDTQIGVRLKEERKRLKLSQQAIADFVGVRREMWAKYEGGAEPGATVLARASEAGIDVLYVLTGRRGPIAGTEKSPSPTGDVIPIGVKNTGNLNRIDVMALVIDALHKNNRTLPSEKLFALVELLLRYQGAGAALSLEAVGEQIRLVS